MAKSTGTRGDKTPSPSAAALPPAAARKSNTSQSPQPPEPAKASPSKNQTGDAAEPPKASSKATQPDHERRRRIAESAYYRAERRGFAPGGEHEDWLEAENEVDRGTPTDLPPENNAFPSPK